MFNSFSQKIILSVIIICGTAALFYTFYKASHTSFTHDESYTYNNYVGSSIWSIISYEETAIPNNHILNSLFMKLFQFFLGSSEFALRLPNLLAHIVYMIFTFLWLKKLKNQWVLLVGFVALNLNPFLLDYFALARGYGLSAGFMFLSFYFFYKFVNGFRKKDNVLSFILGALSVLSNFALLNYYLALWIIFNLFILFILRNSEYSFSKKFQNLFQYNLPPLIISATLGGLLYNPLKKIHRILPGGNHGFWADTVRSEILRSTANRFGEVVDCLFISISIFLIFSFLLVIHSINKSHFNSGKSPYLLIFLFLVIPSLSTVLQHKLFGTPYLDNRHGIFLIVLFNINFCYLIFYLMENFKSKIFPVLLSSVYTILLLINFILNFNLTLYVDYNYDAYTKNMLEELEKVRKNSSNPDAKISLGITWIYEPIINYYRATKHLDWLNEVNREGYKTGEFDYYYIMDDSSFIKKSNKIVIKKFYDGKCILAKNKFSKQF